MGYGDGIVDDPSWRPLFEVLSGRCWGSICAGGAAHVGGRTVPGEVYSALGDCARSDGVCGVVEDGHGGLEEVCQFRVSVIACGVSPDEPRI